MEGSPTTQSSEHTSFTVSRRVSSSVMCVTRRSCCSSRRSRILQRRLEILVHAVDGHAMLGELGRNGRKHARIVVNHETHRELGLGSSIGAFFRSLYNGMVGPVQP